MSIGTTVLDRVGSYDYLGISLDEVLNMEKAMANTYKKQQISFIYLVL